MGMVRIDGMTFPLLDGDEMTTGDLARIEAHFGIPSSELAGFTAIAVVGVAWASARAGGSKMTLADVERAKTIELLDDEGNVTEDPTPADELPDEVAGSEKALDDDGAPTS